MFTEEASGIQPQAVEIEIAGKKPPEEEELTEISAETVRGCWEMEGSGKSAEEILRSVSGRTEAASREEVASVARSIYTEGFGVQQQAQQKEQQPAARIGHRLLEEQHSNNNSYEVRVNFLN